MTCMYFVMRLVSSLTLLLLLLLLSSSSCVADERSASATVTYNSTACSTPCENGTYEVMACSESHPKLCKGRFMFVEFLVYTVTETRRTVDSNNDNTSVYVYGTVVLTPATARIHSDHLMNACSASAGHLPCKRGIPLWLYESACRLLYRPHPPSPFIAITHPEKLRLILPYHGGWKAAVRQCSPCPRLSLRPSGGRVEKKHSLDLLCAVHTADADATKLVIRGRIQTCSVSYKVSLSSVVTFTPKTNTISLNFWPQIITCTYIHTSNPHAKGSFTPDSAPYSPAPYGHSVPYRATPDPV